MGSEGDQRVHKVSEMEAGDQPQKALQVILKILDEHDI